MSTTTTATQKELFGHPIGLYVLFFTEMWERFSYYGMRALLVIYMIAEASHIDGPGLGWSKLEAYQLYGWYVMLVYVISIPGGILADKVLGQRKTVMLGAVILCLGHGTLAIEAEWAFFTGLSLIILGVGCLKPNISTMVGGLYKEGDIRRDKGFSIFYIGINLGSLQVCMKYDSTLLTFKGVKNELKTSYWISFINTSNNMVEWGGYDPSTWGPKTTRNRYSVCLRCRKCRRLRCAL